MVKRETQATAVIFVILALGLIYVGYQTSGLQRQMSELEKTVAEIGGLIVRTGVTIDNGRGTRTERVYLTKGATALEALRRVAVVETTFYAGLGEFINAIDGIRNDPAAGKYWMWYIWENGTWRMAPVGAGAYKLRDGDNIKFSYEVPFG